MIGTGDYQYASTTGASQQAQLNLYMGARAAFDGPFFPAMGNHECTGYTDSNCGTAREQLVARVRDPRRAHERWNDAGLALLHAMGADAVATTDVGCYMAGCMATFTFANAAIYRDAVAELEASPGYAAWTGGTQLSAPEVGADDTVVIAVVLQRPDYRGGRLERAHSRA